MLTKARLQKLNDLQGLISHETGIELARLASVIPPEFAIVEVGSYRGKSTCYLAEGARRRAGAHVWAVDAWDLPGNPEGRFGYTTPATREAFDQQVSALKLEGQITAIRGFSRDVAAAWDGPQVGLLFVDGSHLYRDVRADYEAWEQHLAAAATVVFDDYDTPRNPGVAQFVGELMASYGLFWEFAPSSLAIGRRT